MFSWLRKTSLWILAVPVLTFVLGCGLNDAVLAANGGAFPVQWNAHRMAKVSVERRAAKAQAEYQFDQAIVSGKIDEAITAAVKLADAGEDLSAFERDGYLDDVHKLMTKQTHLNFLADWIDVGFGTASIGDGLIWLGTQGMEYMWVVWFVTVVQKLAKKEE